MIIYILVSLLALYGIYRLIADMILKMQSEYADGGKLCLAPKPGDEGLEGKIRCFFIEEISEKLGMDGRLYIHLEENDPNHIVVQKLTREYPRIVLLDHQNWGRINTEG